MPQLRRSSGSCLLDAVNLLDPVDALDLFGSAPGGYVVVDVQGVVRRTNYEFARIVGLDEDEITGRPLSSVMSVGGRMFFETHLLPMLEHDGVVREIELDLLRPRRAAGAGPLQRQPPDARRRLRLSRAGHRGARAAPLRGGPAPRDPRRRASHGRGDRSGADPPADPDPTPPTADPSPRHRRGLPARRDRPSRRR